MSEQNEKKKEAPRCGVCGSKLNSHEKDYCTYCLPKLARKIAVAYIFERTGVDVSDDV